MGTDYFFSAAFVPVLFLIAVLMLFLIFAKRAWLNENVFDLRWGAVLSGTLGALAGLYVYSAISSYLMAVERVSEYESLREQGALSLALGWSIYLFILFAPFLLAGMAFLLLPILAILSRLRLVSVFGFFLIVMIFVGLVGLLTYISPGNNWCEANIALCTQQSATGAFAFALPVALGFIVGARLPLIFSERAAGK
ncbi:hypothetical protein [Hyphomonas chukchiensis]|uniref:Uncharacterized protein n=1 Tax=Hyphomonas chukchiensis TaxID=1280947 RepID=A0A062UBB2_9PROT|nr:hypothetical protein [Hyphomonas chukchiensis]KCZ57636.1 hypothetical protein HY30_05515 [Hyphomonas chukchiensis]